MEQALITLLSGHTALTALVGNRISWVLRPQGDDLPAIVLHQISGQPDRTFSGQSGLYQSRIQLDCYALSYATSLQVSRAVEAAIAVRRGFIGNVNFQGLFIDAVRSGVEDLGTDNIFSTSLDLLVWHSVH